MSDATITLKSHPKDQPIEHPTSAWSPLWRRITLGAVLLISVFMEFFQLGQNGFANPFYASGVRSMLDSWHNFFFASYDPGGFVTIDKPAFGLWLQTISAKIFGFSAFSVYLPQALAAVFSVLILYHLVRRHFGVTAGLLAALALAITPLSVVTSRNNTIDSTLVFSTVVGAWAVLKATETGKLRWLLLCAVAVGVGYNIKMTEVFLVVPAFGLLYLLAAPRKIWTRIWHLAVALLVMLVIALSWSVAVDLTPASQRPYVGSTQDNSEISLAIGYNGLQRLLGNPFSSSKETQTNTPSQAASGSSNSNNSASSTTGANITSTIGTAGPFRLFSEPLAGQIAWLLPSALLGMLALAWQRRLRFREDREQMSLVLWGTWLLTTGVFFSVVGYFHPYYLLIMTPAIAALFGIGVVVLWSDYRRVGWRGWLLPIALVLTAVEQIYIISSNPAWGTWLIPVIAIACFLAALILVAVRLFPQVTTRFTTNERRTRLSLQSVVVLGLIGLMMASAVWSIIPVLQNTGVQIPSAGPTTNSSSTSSLSTDTKLISYLEAHQGKTKYLLAVTRTSESDPIILATNKPVMALGGFTGSDPILTTAKLKVLIANGTVRYFLFSSGSSTSGVPEGKLNIKDLPANIKKMIQEGGISMSGSGGSSDQSTLTSWVTKNCATVPTNLWQSSSSNPGTNGGGNQTLYDCATPKQGVRVNAGERG
jgi:4-amino-4-deoxy-L-arabinose transferase-like glycosyltransferase